MLVRSLDYFWTKYDRLEKRVEDLKLINVSKEDLKEADECLSNLYTTICIYNENQDEYFSDVTSTCLKYVTRDIRKLESKYNK